MGFTECSIYCWRAAPSANAYLITRRCLHVTFSGVETLLPTSPPQWLWHHEMGYIIPFALSSTAGSTCTKAIEILNKTLTKDDKKRSLTCPQPAASFDDFYNTAKNEQNYMKAKKRKIKNTAIRDKVEILLVRLHTYAQVGDVIVLILNRTVHSELHEPFNRHPRLCVHFMNLLAWFTVRNSYPAYPSLTWYTVLPAITEKSEHYHY